MASPETIAAIATPPGRGGIGVVRVSGPNAAEVARAVAGALPPPRMATRAAFRDADGTIIDQGLALYFPAPRSYTGEAVLELHAHGGPVVLRLLLRRCLAVGARLAHPGEFTQRAFLNGKLDLAQAEGVADLIDAATATAARAAARSLTGAFSQEIRALVDGVVELRMLTEATLDFPDEDVDFLEAARARERLATLRAHLDAILAQAERGALLRDGLAVVLIGQPNVGKSSVLNRLVGDDVAIVTAIAGTTRDTVSSQIEISGIPLTVIDTAGLRPTDDPIETLGIERTWEAVRRADLALVLVDARDGEPALAPPDEAIAAQLPSALPRIIVHNKTDLLAGEPPIDADGHGAGTACEVWISAKTGRGLEALREAMLAAVGATEAGEGAFLARERHLVALRDAWEHLGAAAGHLDAAPAPLELLAEELRAVQTALGTITGEFSADDLLGVIFSRFCIGK